MDTHDIREAGRQLDAVPHELRGWEWRHLQGRLDQSLAVVAGPPGMASIAFCPPGRPLAVADGRSEYRLLDAVSGECLAVRRTDFPCHRVFAFMTSAGPSFVLDPSDNELSLSNGNGVALCRITVPHRSTGEPPCAMAMSLDGQRLAIEGFPYSRSPLVAVFDTSTGLLAARVGGIGASPRASISARMEPRSPPSTTTALTCTSLTFARRSPR